MRRASYTTVFLTVVLAACASGGGGGGSGGGDRNRIGTEELSELTGFDAYDAVQRLRPQWLRARGGDTSDLPATFVDGRHFGDVTQLRAFNTADILAIRFLSAADATTLYGTGYPGGVIEIQTR
jgi:hypothetical protein